MNSVQCMELANYAPFQNRVKYFMVTRAVLVNRIAIDDNTNDTDRIPDEIEEAVVNFSSKILSLNLKTNAYVIAVTTQNTIINSVSEEEYTTPEAANDLITDSDLQTTVNAVYEEMSLRSYGSIKQAAV